MDRPQDIEVLLDVLRVVILVGDAYFPQFRITGMMRWVGSLLLTFCSWRRAVNRPP
jgi:hypothetical protein